MLRQIYCLCLLPTQIGRSHKPKKWVNLPSLPVLQCKSGILSVAVGVGSFARLSYAQPRSGHRAIAMDRMLTHGSR